MSDSDSRSGVETRASSSSGSKNNCEICKFRSYINADEIETAKTFVLSLPKSIKTCNKYAETRNMKFKVSFFLIFLCLVAV